MKTITTVLFLLFTASIFSQNIKYKVNSSENFNKKSQNEVKNCKLIIEDEKFYYIDLDTYNGYNNIIKISKNFKTSTSKEITLSKNARHETLARLGDQIVIINKIHSGNTNTINLKTINKSNLTIEESIDLYIDEEGNHSKMIEYSIKESEDNSKLAVLYTKYNNKHEAYKFGVIVVNDDLEILWHEDNFSPRFSGTYSQEDFFASNNGDVYLIGRVIKNPKNNPEAINFSQGTLFTNYYTYEIDNPEYKYQIYRISEEGSTTDFLNLEIPDYDIRNIRIQINGETLLGYGIFRKMGSIDALGCFTSEIDIDKETIKMIDIKKFNKNIITKGFSEKELAAYNKRKKKGIILDPYNYKLSDIIYKENGDAYFIAEQRLYGTMENTNMKTSTFKYSDIFIIDLYKQKTIENINKISKRQNYNEPWFLSYSEVCSENTHYFLFNITEKHKLRKCILASINSDNEKSRQELMYYKNRKTQGFLPLSKPISKPGMLLYSKLEILIGRNYSFETMSFEE